MTIQLIPMQKIRSRAIDWLWPGTVAIGKLTLLAGDPGLGKSFITMDLAARTTTGGPWPLAPDDATADAPGDVLIASAEDDPADTIRPRLERAGADLARVHLIHGVQRVREWDDFNLEDHIAMLGDAIASVGRARLVVIDPVSAYLPRIDSNNNTQVRSVLKGLSDLAAAHRVAVVAVSHLRKNTNGPMTHQTLGSLAFTAAARSVWMARPVKGEGKGDGARALVPAKSNIHPDAEALRYAVEDGRIEWLGRTTLADLDGGPRLPKRDAAETRAKSVAFLTEQLAAGPQRAGALRDACAAAGLAWNTVRKHAESAGVTTTRVEGVTWWELAA